MCLQLRLVQFKVLTDALQMRIDPHTCLEGALVTATPFDEVLFRSPLPLPIGRLSDGLYPMRGGWDVLRITVDAARHTECFTVPTEQ